MSNRREGDPNLGEAFPPNEDPPAKSLDALIDEALHAFEAARLKWLDEAPTMQPLDPHKPVPTLTPEEVDRSEANERAKDLALIKLKILYGMKRPSSLEQTRQELLREFSGMGNEIDQIISELTDRG